MLNHHERFLLIGDESDLPHLRAMMDGFPNHAEGNLYIEVSGSRSPLMCTPPGISVSLLRRQPDDPRLPGARACAALESWVGEWVHGDHERREHHTIWVGMPGNPLVEQMCDALLHRCAELHLHRPCTGHCQDTSQAG